MAATVEGVFNSILSITDPGNTRPGSVNWRAAVNWKITSDMEMKEGDTFTLHMPNVYKFTSSAQTLQIKAGSLVLANCDLFSGDNIVGYSEVQCTATAEVANVGTASGTITFAFTFNSGYSSDEVNLEAASVWSTGTNTIRWTDGPNVLTKDVTFEGGNTGVIEGSAENGVYGLRALVNSNTKQHYLLGPRCLVDFS